MNACTSVGARAAAGGPFWTQSGGLCGPWGGGDS